ncbi:MAG: RNA methyltransferase [Actinobacteria bacterium]|nr:RNA methyltransferase [Actinomycetota bacterium]
MVSPSEPIVSLANDRIKRLVRLRNRRDRDRSGHFLVEGFRELRRAVVAGVVIDEIYACPGLFLGGNEAELVEGCAAAGAEVFEVAEAPFRKASYRDRPEGLLGVARQFAMGLDRLSPPAAPLLLIAEAIEKPGNLGTMLRTSEAAGADAVIVCDPATDPFNPNVVRASLGTLFDVPLAVASTADTIVWLRERGIRSLAATPGATIAHHDADLTGPVALVIGSEQYGLTDAWLEGANQQIVIPMPGSVDSLNAAMSAGILLFEAVRQRSLGR